MSRRRPGRARGAPLLRDCPNVLWIGQWRPSDRPPLLQSCRDNTPCAHAQPLYVLVSDRLWAHGGRAWIGRCRGGARCAPLPSASPNVLGIGQWRPSDRPPLFQSCRDNTPCAHVQPLYVHVSDILRVHGDRVWIGCWRGGARCALAVCRHYCVGHWALQGQRQVAIAPILQRQHPMHARANVVCTCQ